MEELECQFLVHPTVSAHGQGPGFDSIPNLFLKCYRLRGCLARLTRDIVVIKLSCGGISWEETVMRAQLMEHNFMGRHVYVGAFHGKSNVVCNGCAQTAHEPLLLFAGGGPAGGISKMNAMYYICNL